MLPLVYEAKLPYGAETGPSKEYIFYHSKATELCCIFFKKYCINWETKYIFRFIQFFFPEMSLPFMSTECRLAGSRNGLAEFFLEFSGWTLMVPFPVGEAASEATTTVSLVSNWW